MVLPRRLLVCLGHRQHSHPLLPLTDPQVTHIFTASPLLSPLNLTQSLHPGGTPTSLRPPGHVQLQCLRQIQLQIPNAVLSPKQGSDAQGKSSQDRRCCTNRLACSWTGSASSTPKMSCSPRGSTRMRRITHGSHLRIGYRTICIPILKLR